MSPNQVVAYNLARARELQGWTQERAAEALEPYLGVRWSKASFSQAERSVAGKVMRQFDADEIVAFSRAFNLPVTWFFLPPPPWGPDGEPVKLATADAERFGEEVSLLVDLVFGEDYQQQWVAQRLREVLDQLGRGRLTKAQRQITDLAAQRVEALAGLALDDLAQWQAWLRNVANGLEDLEERARRAADDEPEGPAGRRQSAARNRGKREEP